METKKNPDKDLNTKTFQFFCVGLILSISAAITAFEWRTVKKTTEQLPSDETVNDLTWVLPAKTFSLVEEPPQKLKQKEILMVNPLSLREALPNDQTPQPDYSIMSDSTINYTEISLPIEAVDTIMLFPEQQPSPINGLAEFYQMLAQNIKYPRAAIRNQTEGRVFVEFIVSKIGKPTEMKVIKGIGFGCDEEAMRVLAMSRWNPGKQRGRPVKVKMVMPIVFQLRH